MGFEADKKIRKFLTSLERNFSPIKVILFGSRARNDWLLESDYDFILVSEKFSGTDFLLRAGAVFKKCGVRFAADVLCYTPEEFKTKSREIGVVREAVRTGKVLIR
ncbi:nucleotidyltransferase domain-containing protein [Candidatus Micrarchaeota archaeon]|nr:nucleotidyltransferase domain-containing protein [Candidatus Micrarchaeota archaeon]